MVQGDGLILSLLSLFVLGVLFVWFRNWLIAPSKAKFPIEPDAEIMVSEAVELLEYAGYEVWTGKRRIPVSIQINGRTTMESRLYIDHFAADRDELYVVKLARDRMPVEMTGSGLRDRLLIYQLLYEQVQGVLLVDPKLRTIDKIRFSIEI